MEWVVITDKQHTRPKRPQTKPESMHLSRTARTAGKAQELVLEGSAKQALPNKLAPCHDATSGMGEHKPPRGRRQSSARRGGEGAPHCKSQYVLPPVQNLECTLDLKRLFSGARQQPQLMLEMGGEVGLLSRNGRRRR